MGFVKTSLAVSVALGLASTPAFAGVTRMGRMTTSQSMTGTIVFKLRHLAELEQFIQQTTRPGPNYRKFLTTRQFRARYAPTGQQIKQVVSYLDDQGLRVTRRYGNNLALQVIGTSGEFERTFNTRLMNFRQSGDKNSRVYFHRPTNAPRMPGALKQGGVLTVVGLSNQYKSHSLRRSRSQIAGGNHFKITAGSNTIATGTPGDYTVADVANLYNINPLYGQGIDGTGITLGIATYADFLPSDAYTYWDSIALNYKPNRITKVRVDGGGEFGADAGTGETSLDVEQSGGLAPYADIVVYDAPNSDQGTIDLFTRIVADNRVDTLSYSWGLPEIFYAPELNGGVDFRPELTAQNQLFMEAAAQGISVFVAAGDSGAYDTNSQKPYPDYSKVVSVDSPSDSPFVTAAGGTTVPITLLGACNDGSTVPIKVTDERAWAYDYLAGFFQRCRNMSPVQADLFATGAGGGVSTMFAQPTYQNGISGIDKSPSNQAYIDFTSQPVGLLKRLPANYAGRNLPDLSMNADPDSGYLVYSTPDGGLLDGYGGTSFVAPQLNGITALINQRAGGRLGLLNPQLYRLFKQRGYGINSPFNDITSGDNWYWQSRSGYDPATGIGTPNAARLAEALSGN